VKHENKKAMTAKRTADMHTELRRLNDERAGVLKARDEATEAAKDDRKQLIELQHSFDAYKAEHK
jgi:hypothetical protein